MNSKFPYRAGSGATPSLPMQPAVQITVRLDALLQRRLVAMAVRRSTSIRALVNTAIRRLLEDEFNV